VVDAALRAAAQLDDERMRTYFDLVYATLGELARAALEALMPLSNYEYKSEFAKKYVAQGREEGVALGREEGVALGREEGVRAALHAVLAARGITLSEPRQQQVANCADVAVLERWLARAATGDGEGDVFG
jgi:flagellar biosynthesis/type III secretory pathway protein FliH